MKKPKITQEEIELRKKPINIFTCGHPDCSKLDSMEFLPFQKHLESAHGLSKSQMQGKRSMNVHMDGDYWFSYNYTWTLESGLTFGQYIKAARANDDPMRFY